MRITKVKIDKGEEAKKPMVLMHRRSNKGSLILESIHNQNKPAPVYINETNRIINHLKNDNFKTSILKKTLEDSSKIKIELCETCQSKKNRKELCEDCKSKPGYLAKSLASKLEKLFDSIINGIIENKSVQLKPFDVSSDEIVQLEHCLKHKFRSSLNYRDKTNQPKTFCLLVDLSDYLSSKDRTHLISYQEWVSYYLETKKDFTRKSVIENRIVVDYDKDNTLSSRKTCLKEWEADYKASGKLNLSHLKTTFGLDAKPLLFPEPSDETNFQFNLSVKKALQLYQKDLFGAKDRNGKDNPNYLANRANKELTIYYNEVVKYIEHYFPIKNKNKNKTLTLKQAQHYLKPDTIHNTVTHQIENAIHQQLLQKGKAALHQFNEETNSSTLSSVKRNEFFVLNLIEACAFATNNIRNIVDCQQAQDILGHTDLIKSLKAFETPETAPPSTDSENHFSNEIYRLFFDEELAYGSATEIESFKQTIWAMRGAVQQIRNKVVHYKTDSLNTIFNLDTFDYDGLLDKHYTNTRFKTYLDNDLSQAKARFVEQLQSNDVLNYYTSQNIQTFLSRFKFSLSKCPIPFAPGFKTIYSEGSNLQKGNSTLQLTFYHLKDKTAEETKASKAYDSYRFLLKLIYNYCFLNYFLNDDHKEDFSATVDFILEKNRELAGKDKKSSNAHKNSKYQYAFKEIPRMDEDKDENKEMIADYLSKIHSLAVQEENKKKEKGDGQFYHTRRFIERLFAKGFDDFLKKQKIDFLLSPNQRLSKEETQPEYRTLIDQINIQHQIKSNSDAHIAFYTFCKLLDAQHLSDLRNEFIKYQASAITPEDRTKFSFIIDILGLCLLSVDSPKNKADEEENKIGGRMTDAEKTRWETDLSPFVEKEGDQFVGNDCYMQQDNYTPVVHASIRLIRKYGTMELLKQLIEQETADKNSPSFKVTAKDYSEWQSFKVQIPEKGRSLIEEYMETRNLLHKKWVEINKGNKKDKIALNKEEEERYKKACEEIERYDWLDNKIHLVHLKQLHNLMIEILSRLTRFVALWDRDFVTFDRQLVERDFIFTGFINLREICKNNKNIEKYKENIIKRTDGSAISSADFDNIKKDTDFKQTIYSKTFFKENKNAPAYRNFIAHYNYITKNATVYSMIDLINNLIELMQYDRKLRNAVSKSIIQVFDRHGMELRFKFKDDTKGNKKENNEAEKHELVLDKDSVRPKTIKHIGNAEIETKLVSEEYCNLCKKLLEMKK